MSGETVVEILTFIFEFEGSYRFSNWDVNNVSMRFVKCYVTTRVPKKNVNT